MRSLGKKKTQLFLYFAIFLCFGCTKSNTQSPVNTNNNAFALQGINEFKRGDILVKPNTNVLPGTSQIVNGLGFGHAAIITKGYKHHNIDTLLANVTIIQSRSNNVPKEFQVNETICHFEHEDPIIANIKFGEKYKGNRYRLRLNISEAEIDSIIQFARLQKGDLSCYNASKAFPVEKFIADTTRNSWADNSQWYCSLLAWQSFYYVLGIDLDENGGYYVYPNDLISSSVFDLTNNKDGRARF